MIKKTKIAFIFLLALSLILPQTVLGIGQITQPIIFKDVLRGQTLESILVLYNSEEKEVVYKLVADGKIKNWASFYSLKDLKNPITAINVPAKSNIRAKVKFIVPKDIPNGEYTGEAAITVAPEKNKNKTDSNVSVGTRVGRPVSITVTGKQIIKFEASITPITYVIEKDKPLEINAIYYNTGNVAIKPDLQLRISKKDQAVFNAIFPYPENEEEVKPLASKTIHIEWQTTGQEEGIYKVETKVLLNNATIFEDDFTFSIGLIVFNNINNANNNSKFLGFISGIGGNNITFIPILASGFLTILGIFAAAFLIYSFSKPKKKKVMLKNK